MTRKDYILMSEKIREVYLEKKDTMNDDFMKGYFRAILALAGALEYDNPRCDGWKFAMACTEERKE